MALNNTSRRLKQIMGDRHLRQVDILRMCKPYCEKYKVTIGRNDLSQYVNGKVMPGHQKLLILSEALCLNEAWLAGYDVPMDRTITDFSISDNSFVEIYERWNLLNSEGKNKVREYMRDLCKIYVDTKK